MDMQAIVQAKISELRYELELETIALEAREVTLKSAQDSYSSQAAKVQSLGMAIASLEYELNKFLEFKKP